jgi:catechol 2,3-dioxygenase-like lactoylglutathione lyase family enzyme
VTVRAIETGLVSSNDALPKFYAEVFELEELEPLVFPVGTIHKMKAPGGPVIKVMVPTDAPARAVTADPFHSVAGVRYMTIRVDEWLEPIIERATARGGRVQVGPMDLPDGSRIVVLADPDGNTVEVNHVSSFTTA